MSISPEQPYQNLKQRYGQLYEIFTQLLAEYDPMGLIKGGAPHDEYDLEVEAVLRCLPDVHSPGHLGRLFYDTFVEYFGSAFAPPDAEPSERIKARFKAIGEKAWMAWKQWEGEAKKGLHG